MRERKKFQVRARALAAPRLLTSWLLVLLICHGLFVGQHLLQHLADLQSSSAGPGWYDNAPCDLCRMLHDVEIEVVVSPASLAVTWTVARASDCVVTPCSHTPRARGVARAPPASSQA